MSFIKKYIHMIPGDEDLWGVAVAGGCYEYDSIFGIGDSAKAALIDAAKNYDAFRSKSQNPYDYQIIKEIGMTQDAGDFFLTRFDPLCIMTAYKHNLPLEDAIRWNYDADDELGEFSYNIHDAVYQLNMMNGFVPFSQYGSYFWIYAEDPKDTELEWKVHRVFEEFNKDNKGKRYSLYIENIFGDTVESILDQLVTDYDMDNTTLSDIHAEQIPGEFLHTADDKLCLDIPVEVMYSAKHRSSLNECITYWKLFADVNVDQLVFDLDDVFED